MMRRAHARTLAAVVAVALAVAPAGAQSPQHDGHGHYAAPPSEGHGHGAPDGWTFTLPNGDSVKGREVFVNLGCYSCHEVKGQQFPGATRPGDIGPELSEMAVHHDAEFFAEAIMNPNRVIDGSRWRAADGTSRMPSFNHAMTVQDLVDLVAFLKSLAPPAASSGGHRH